MFIKDFNSTLLHKITKPIIINGNLCDGNWVALRGDATITNNDNKHSKINMTPADKSNNPITVAFKTILQEDRKPSK